MPLGIFSIPNTSDAVVLAGADGRRRELERGAAARAPGLDVDDRDTGARRARRAPCGPAATPRVRGAAERGLEAAGSMPASASAARTAATPISVTVAVARSGRTDGCRRRRSRRLRHEPAPGRTRRSAPRRRRRRGRARRSAAAPACRTRATPGRPRSRRVMTRRPSGSSTTPKPYGTGPIVPGRSGGDGGPAPERRVVGQLDRLDVVGAAVGTLLEAGEVACRPHAGSTAAEQTACRR